MEATLYSAGIAGITALLVAGLSNFGAESYKRHRDATALAAGLAGELRGYLPDFHGMIRMLSDLQKHAAAGNVVPLPKIARPTSPVFDGNVARLGVLGVDLAEQVSFVYATIEAFRSLMTVVVAEGATPCDQATALLGAIDTLQRLSPAAEVVERLRAFAHRPWLSPTE